MIIPMNELDGVLIFNICDLVDALGINSSTPWRTASKLVKDWCKSNCCYYYARVREDFSYYEAVKEAQKMGFTNVLVEDLS